MGKSAKRFWRRLARAADLSTIFVLLGGGALLAWGAVLRDLASSSSSTTSPRELVASAEALARDYLALVKCLRSINDAAYGDDYALIRAPGYALLWKYHQRLVDEARRHRDRLDWGAAVPTAADLDNCLTESLYPWHWFAEGLTAREVHRYAADGFTIDLVGRAWMANFHIKSVRISDDGKRLLLAGKVTSGSVVRAEADRLRSQDEEPQLKPGVAINVTGMIHSIEANTIMLSPARVHSWETPSAPAQSSA